MDGRARHLVLLFALLFLAPAQALANAGTPLMWATGFHLLIGNALIGMCEGALLARCFKVPPRRAIASLIAANYFSAWIGLLVLGVSSQFVSISDSALYTVGRALPALVAGAYLITIALEWPFTALALKGKSRLVLRSLAASVFVQTASYAVLVPFYFSASSRGLLTDVKTDPSLVAEQGGREVQIYYVSPNGNAVFRCFLDGTGATKVADLPAGNSHARLSIKLNREGPYWDLWVDGLENHDAELLVPRFAKRVARQSFGETISFDDTRISLRPASEQSAWVVQTPRPWDGAVQGIFVSNSKTGSSYRVALEVPGFNWPTRYLTLLPKDRAVFQLGGSDPQIVLLDVPSRRLGLVARGGSPLAVFNGTIPQDCPGCDRPGWGECPEGCLWADSPWWQVSVESGK